MRTEFIRIETPAHPLDGAHYTGVSVEEKVAEIVTDWLTKTLGQCPIPKAV